MPQTPLLRFTLFLAVTVMSAGCSYATKAWLTPEVTLVNLRPGPITAEQQSFIVGLNVQNPNDRTLPIKGATYNLEIEGHDFANGSSSLDEQIPAFSEGVVDVLVNTNLMDLVQTFPALVLTRNKLGYRVSGVLMLAGGFLPVPFRYSGEIDTAQIVGQLMR